MEYQGFLAKNNVKDFIKFRRFKQSELIWQAVNIFEDNRGKLWNDVMQQDVVTQIQALQQIDQDAAKYYIDNGNMWIRLKKDATFGILKQGTTSYGDFNWKTAQFIIYASSDTAETITLNLGGYQHVKIKIVYESYDIEQNKFTFNKLILGTNAPYSAYNTRRPYIPSIEIEHYFKTQKNQDVFPAFYNAGLTYTYTVNHKYFFCEVMDAHQVSVPQAQQGSTVNFKIENTCCLVNFTQEYLDSQVSTTNSPITINYYYINNNCLVYHNISNYEMTGITKNFMAGTPARLKYVTDPDKSTWWEGALKDSLTAMNSGWAVDSNATQWHMTLYGVAYRAGTGILWGNPNNGQNANIISVDSQIASYIDKDASILRPDRTFRIRVLKQTYLPLDQINFVSAGILQKDLGQQKYIIQADEYNDCIIVSSIDDRFGTKSTLGFTKTTLNNCLLRCLFYNLEDTIINMNDFAQKIQCNDLDTVYTFNNSLIREQIKYSYPLPQYQNTYSKQITAQDGNIYTVNCDNYLIEAARRSSVNTISSLVNRVLSDNAMETLLDNVKATIIGGQNLTAITNPSDDNLPHSLQYALNANELILGSNELKNIDITNDYLLVLRDDIDWQGVTFTKNGAMYNNYRFLLNTMENFFVLAKTEEEEYVILSILQNNVCPTVFSNARRILYTMGNYNFVRAFQIWQAQSMNITNQTFNTKNFQELSSSSGSWQFTDLTLKFTNTSFIIL